MHANLQRDSLAEYTTGRGVMHHAMSYTTRRAS
jgi:hypothetical protein